MKASIKHLEEKKQFKPFTLELVVESREEALLLWHIANSSALKELLDLPDDLPYELSEHVFFIIDKELIKQGIETALFHVE